MCFRSHANDIDVESEVTSTVQDFRSGWKFDYSHSLKFDGFKTIGNLMDQAHA